MGLISDKLSNGTDVLTAKTNEFMPTTRAVNQPSETVAGQMSGLLSKDNPYIERARSKAAEVANARGLSNSSMAVQAGEAAAYDAAMPIASADANTFTTAARDNQGYQNTAGQFNAAAGNTANLNAAAAGNQSLQATQQGQIQTGLIASQGEQARMTQAAGGDIQSRLAAEQGVIQTGLIGTQGEQSRLTQSAGGDIQARIAELQGQIQTGLVGAQGAQSRMTAAQQDAAQKELVSLQGQIQTGLSKQGAEQTAELSAQQATQSSTLQAQQAEQQKALSAQAAAQAEALQAKTAASAAALQQADAQAKQIMATADQATRLSMANIEADYKTLMQTSASAGDVYKSAMSEMTKIMADPNMDAASKQQSLNNQITILKSGMNLIGSVNGIDLTALLPA